VKQSEFDELLKTAKGPTEREVSDRRVAQRMLQRMLDRGEATIVGGPLWPPTLVNPDPEDPYENMDEKYRYYQGPVWGWFSLTYASYAVLPRAVICEMPIEWQKKFVALMDEVSDTLEWDEPNSYTVQIRDKKGRFTYDPLCSYKYPPANAVRKKGNPSDL